MSLGLLHILQALVSNRGARVSADEADLWDDGVLDGLESAGLLRSLPPATSVACRGCDGDHDVEIQREGDGDQASFWHRCPEAGRVEVPAERLNLWAAHLDGLLRLIQAALGDRARRSVIAPERAWMWQGAIIDGRPRTVYFVRGHGWPDGGEIASQVRATAETLILVSDPPTSAPAALRTGRIVSLWQVIDQDDADRLLVSPDYLAEAAIGSPSTSPTPREARHRRRGDRDEAITALTNALVLFLTNAQRQLTHQGKADASAFVAYQPPTQKQIGAMAGIRVHTRVGRALQDSSPAGCRLRELWLATRMADGVMGFRNKDV
jgi:hypothetical protein